MRMDVNNFENNSSYFKANRYHVFKINFWLTFVIIFYLCSMKSINSFNFELTEISMVYKYLSDNVSNFLERKTIFKVLPRLSKNSLKQHYEFIIIYYNLLAWWCTNKILGSNLLSKSSIQFKNSHS